MEITEVRIKLMDDPDDRLRAFCSITFDDCFVIRDLKIIEGTSGPFVAMPSRKLTAHCHKCGSKNHLRAGYCNQCGAKQYDDQITKDEDGRAKLYADIAHPINSSCREMIQERVIADYELELDRAQQPDYRSTYDDYFGEEDTVRAAGPTKSQSPTHNGASNGDSRNSDRGNARRDREIRTADGQKSRIEPAASKPRGPHRTNGAPTSDRPQHAEEGGFGDGIF